MNRFIMTANLTEAWKMPRLDCHTPALVSQYLNRSLSTNSLIQPGSAAIMSGSE